MRKAGKFRLTRRVKRAAAFVMAAVLAAGSLSFDSFAEGSADARASANSVSYEVIDLNEQGGKLEVTNADGVMTLKQSATTGSLPDTNVSYLVFPKTADKGTLSLKLKVKSFNFGKGSGVFVGSFMPDNAQDTRYFLTMGFRNPEQETTNSLSPYWWKQPTEAKPKNIGNGSPKITLKTDTEYGVELTWDASGCMTTKVTGPTSGESGPKTFGKTEVHPDQYDHDDYTAERRFGIAIVGATAEVTNMVYKDSQGNVLFDQNNVEDEPDPSEPNGFVATTAGGGRYLYL